jgi:hypothetical protein
MTSEDHETCIWEQELDELRRREQLAEQSGLGLTLERVW